ncbi:MAG: SDR family NAD(P)-dependent oxidoreductase [Myxococcota bacterium]|nr:SDR family NAD(P)-dependent oxidoreductase [Myxococcota bacterium]
MSHTDRLAIITGANAGLGFECARSILGAPGWQVLLACRDLEKAAAAAERLSPGTRTPRRVHVGHLDLGSLESVRAFVEDCGDRELPPLAALVCNAGVQNVAGTRRTADGFEETFGVNHLGHFLLAHLLSPMLAEDARIVFVASGTHDPRRRTAMPAPSYPGAAALADADAPLGKTTDPAELGRLRYTTSKLCNVFTVYEMHRRLSKASSDLRVNAFCPGLLPGTGLARDYSPLVRILWSYLLPVLTLLPINVHTARRSGRALARLAIDPSLADASGRYFEGFAPARSSDLSYDEDAALELWETSVALTGLDSSKTRIA